MSQREPDAGIVLLFDVVGHTEQAKTLGNTICNDALNIFLKTIKKIASEYEFTHVKDIRDAGLFIGKDPKKAVDFYKEALKQFPVTEGRETKHRGFVIKFRLVAHFCPFTATYNSQGQLIDINGTEIDFLFKKMEKEANEGQMVVSQEFYTPIMQTWNQNVLLDSHHFLPAI